MFVHAFPISPSSVAVAEEGRHQPKAMRFLQILTPTQRPLSHFPPIFLRRLIISIHSQKPQIPPFKNRAPQVYCNVSAFSKSLFFFLSLLPQDQYLRISHTDLYYTKK